MGGSRVLEEPDPNTLRDVEIKRLAHMAEIAYENSIDVNLSMRMRESWHQRYTNTVLALNQLLKDSQYKDYEKRLRVIEESGKTPRRMVWSRAYIRKWATSAHRARRNKQHPKTSRIGGRHRRPGHHSSR